MSSISDPPAITDTPKNRLSSTRGRKRHTRQLILSAFLMTPLVFTLKGKEPHSLPDQLPNGQSDRKSRTKDDKQARIEALRSRVSQFPGTMSLKQGENGFSRLLDDKRTGTVHGYLHTIWFEANSQVQREHAPQNAMPTSSYYLGTFIKVSVRHDSGMQIT
ncbi:hypothetical protein EDD18DRAFT_1418698 [Armillaria luteobubalina]|uniref:Uncharacterized protein n=1 Tax=Armillaria luteobubalina TaxID=153913 RepID=A0AA39PT72_9AGAR|nr:hypothetical protein EDD18DRAFT_1418698 [Armillaria luteobubalina]